MTSNPILDLKYTFISFAQSLFMSEDAPLTWTSDLKTTEIIIADKYSVDLGIAQKRPCIVFSRGDMQFTMSVRGQNAINANAYIYSGGLARTYGYDMTSDLDDYAAFTDLVNVQGTYQIVCKNGNQAEDIASYLIANLIAYKEKFRVAGVHSFTGYAISQESLIKVTSEIELVGINIPFSFTFKPVIYKRKSLYNSAVYYLDTSNNKYFAFKENIDYNVINNGTQIKFIVAPSAIPYISYIDSITLTTYTKTSLISTADPLVFSIATTGIKGRYKLLANTALADIIINE